MKQQAKRPTCPRYLTRRKIGRGGIALALISVSITTIYPLIFVIMTALKDRKEYLLNRYALPKEPTLRQFLDAWNYANVGRYLGNSAIVVITAVVLVWVVCCMAGYALSHLRFPGRRAAFFAILGSMMIAPQVILIPLYAMLNDVGLLNRHIGLILVYVTLAVPFGTYLMTSYLRGVPGELVEAAQVDGANHFQILWRVMVPIAKPAIVTLGIFNFLWMWNELLFALLILNDESVRTLMVGVANLRGQYTTNIPLLSAGLFLAAAPVLLVFMIFQTQLSKGMTMGAVK
ncbi:MAG: carbohydrate ABC transporter permease [Phycisphaerae bacterium]|nr:carbohydrate ABC transporter permease [Phycisphaerae bacterium]